MADFNEIALDSAMCPTECRTTGDCDCTHCTEVRLDERAAVVAWLRLRANDDAESLRRTSGEANTEAIRTMGQLGAQLLEKHIAMLADAISRGDHRSGGSDG